MDYELWLIFSMAIAENQFASRKRIDYKIVVPFWLIEERTANQGKWEIIFIFNQLRQFNKGIYDSQPLYNQQTVLFGQLSL